MNTRPHPHKTSHLKHQRSDSKADQSWQRRFWMLLSFFTLISALSIFFYAKNQQAEAEEDVYISVSVKTVIGTDQLVICKLNLLIDPEQEKGLQKRQKMLEAVIGNALSDTYQENRRPQLASVRENLFLAINQKLPRKLQVQDVLIQELLVGMG